jgi:hypothetical protein
LWDSDDDANAYSRGPYRQVLKALENVIGGPPEIHLFEVSNSTFHKNGAPVAA